MGKSGNGEGSIFQLKNGRWAADITVGWDGNQRIRKRMYGETRADVARQLADAIVQRNKGTLVVDENVTLRVFLEAWLEEVARPTIRPSTYESYRQLIKNHIVPKLGKKKINSLTPYDIQSFLNAKTGEGLSARTVQYLHAVLRRALNIALSWELVTKNVAARVSPPRVRRNEINPLSPEQAKVFMECVKGTRLGPLFIVTLSLGLRQAEALGLKWDDVDFRAETLAVRQTLQKVKGEFELVEPKTDRSARTLNLAPGTLLALHEQRSRQLEERLRVGEYWDEWGLVFSSEVGSPLDRSHVTREFQKALERAGLPRFRFHDLRHTAASFLFAAGADLRDVMEQLGHNKIGITADLYTHILTDRKRELADKMERILFAK